MKDHQVPLVTRECLGRRDILDNQVHGDHPETLVQEVPLDQWEPLEREARRRGDQIKLYMIELLVWVPPITTYITLGLCRHYRRMCIY